MFLNMLPDLLRGSASTIYIFCLLPVLSRLKYDKKYYIMTAAAVNISDSIICASFYLTKNYTGVLYYAIFVYIGISIGFKFLFKDKLLQWCFNCVTVANVYCIIVITSYFVSHFFPYSMYTNTIIRVLFFAVVIVCFKKFVRPLYLEVSENWGAFLLPVSGILVNYLYILVSLGDIERSMNGHLIYFCFITLVAVLTYVATIFSLKSLRQKYRLREENLKRTASEKYLAGEIACYEEFVNTAKQNRHDLHHHNLILLEYLNQNNVEGARSYLEQYNESISSKALTQFSKHPTVNAVLRIFNKKCAENNIDFSANAEGDSFPLPHTDTGVVLSNLLENAFEACHKSCAPERHVFFSSVVTDDKLFVEVRNTAENTVIFNQGIPVTSKHGGGTGVLSVLSIVEKNGGMLDFRQEGSEFFARIIIPLS